MKELDVERRGPRLGRVAQHDPQIIDVVRRPHPEPRLRQALDPHRVLSRVPHRHVRGGVGAVERTSRGVRRVVDAGQPVERVCACHLLRTADDRGHRRAADQESTAEVLQILRGVVDTQVDALRPRRGVKALAHHDQVGIVVR